MLSEIDPGPLGERIVGDDDGFNFPSRRKVSPVKQLLRSPRLVLPKFRLKMAALRPESLLLIIFLGQNDLYTRRGAPEVGQGGHNPPGHAWAPWRAQVGCALLVGPLDNPQV